MRERELLADKRQQRCIREVEPGEIFWGIFGRILFPAPARTAEPRRAYLTEAAP
jgi:hypothetical protein